MIKVVIADHQKLFRAGLVRALSVADGVRIVGQPQVPHRVVEGIREGSPARLDSIDERPAGDLVYIEWMLKASQDHTVAAR